MTAPRRLSALDAAFVSLDAKGTPYEVGCVLVFEGLEVDRIRDYIAACLDHLPAYRQRIERVPFLGHPVWVDDPHFAIDAHVCALSCAPPGTDDKLDDLVGHIFSEQLPSDRPPWRIWIVDGLAGNRVALVAKIHHALVDGVAGVNFLTTMLRGVPDVAVPPRRREPVDAPSRLSLLGAELAYRARGIAALPRRLPTKARELAPALAALLRNALRPASDAGVNPRTVGRRRIVGGWSVTMDAIRKLRRDNGVTVNDVVLAIAAGALRRFLLRRGVAVSRLTDFRAMVPVSTHAKGEGSIAGNQVALLLVPLPVDEPDAHRRLERVAAATRARKHQTHEAAAGDLLTSICDVTAPSVLAGVLGISTDSRGFNVIVTNIPGPPFPLYLLGARLVRFRPIVNLWPGQALGLALVSYDGTLSLGLHADRSVIPDLDGLVEDFARSFSELSGDVRADSAAHAPLPERIAVARARG